VTGGAGFIGHHIVKELVKRGYRVRVFDNLYRVRESTLRDLKAMPNVEFVEGDVRYLNQVLKATEGMDYVSHQAAICLNKSIADPIESVETNLIGTMNVFEAALAHGVQKVVFADSASVYGEPRTLPMGETSELNPITPYCASKLAIEHLAAFYARFRQLKYIGLRYFNVYGPRQPVDAYYTSVIIVFIKRILAGQAPMIKGNGQQSMDFVHVDDIVSANVLALESPVANEIFNVGTNKATTVADLAHILLEAMGRRDLQPQFSGEASLVSERRADYDKIQRLLGWQPSVSAEEGLKAVGLDIMANPDKY
jgi:UDP-glucose 4-epimerase